MERWKATIVNSRTPCLVAEYLDPVWLVVGRIFFKMSNENKRALGCLECIKGWKTTCRYVGTNAYTIPREIPIETTNRFMESKAACFFLVAPMKQTFLENKLLLISINFTPETSHSCLKLWYTMLSRFFLCRSSFKVLALKTCSHPRQNLRFKGRALVGRRKRQRQNRVKHTHPWRMNHHLAYYLK